MKTRALLLTAVFCCTALSMTACTEDEGEVLATLTVSKSGALVTERGRVLRAREPQRYAGHVLQLMRTEDNGRLERLVNAEGDTVREREGEASEANTSTQESADGEDCAVFTDDDGNQVANSCAVPTHEEEDVRCERVDTISDDGEAMICAICYNAEGDVVTRACHPAEPGEPCTSDDPSCLPPEPWPCDDQAGCEPPPTCDSTNDPDCEPPPVEECFVVHEGDMTCRVCVTPDGAEYRECYTDPDPYHCELIRSDDGMLCTYCFDANGEVVERSCEPSCDDATAPNCLPPEPVVCEQFVTQDGQFCTICYDELGNAIERFCEEEPPPPVECREYREPDGRVCVICLTADGDIASRECSEPGCAQTGEAVPCNDDASCPAGLACVNGLCDCGAAPSCRLFETANGFFCEICGDANGDGVEDMADAFCYPPPQDPLFCTEEQGPNGEICVVCFAPDGTLVEEDCHGQTEPPRCVVQETDPNTGAAGDLCEICYDDAGNVIYNSCQHVECWIEELEESGQLVICEVCADASGEISRACHGGGCDPSNPNTDCPPPPQQCEQVESSDGMICWLCYDETGQVVEERCEEPPPPTLCEEYETSDGQVCTRCYDEAGQLVSEQCHGMQCWTEEVTEGGMLFLCDVCATATGELMRECFPLCDDATNCAQTATVFIDPIQCGGNPWEQSGTTEPGIDPSSDEVLQVRAWLEALGVMAYNIRFERVYQDVCEACSCPRGDRLFIETNLAGAEILHQQGFLPA